MPLKDARTYLSRMKYMLQQFELGARRNSCDWNYTLDRNGQRVPKANRVTNPDGSWREEARQGNCVMVKERSATGEYKESRQCNPQNPS